MPPKRKNTIGKRERRALGIPSPVVPAAAAAEPNRSESMVMVTPEEQQQQQQQQSFNFPEAEEPSGYSLSPIAAADESMNQTNSDSVAQVDPNFIMTDSSDSSMGSSPTPLMRKMLGMKKKSPRKSPKKSPRRQNSPPRRKSSPRRNSPRAQTFRRRKLSIDKPEYLKASPSVVQIRNKLMGLAQVASRTRRNSVKINEYAEKIRMTLDELNPYFLFIQQYIAGRGEIQRELNAVVEDRTKLMGERERLVGDLADKSQMNANAGQIDILNRQIGELNKRIEELGAQLESATRANQMYENILRDIPADIDKMRGLIDAEDATLSENITALDQVLSNFSNQLKERLQNTLPQDQHAAFNASRGGGFRKSRKYRKMTRKSRKYRKYRKSRKMTRKSRK